MGFHALNRLRSSCHAALSAACIIFIFTSSSPNCYALAITPSQSAGSPLRGGAEPIPGTSQEAIDLIKRLSKQWSGSQKVNLNGLRSWKGENNKEENAALSLELTKPRRLLVPDPNWHIKSSVLVPTFALRDYLSRTGYSFDVGSENDPREGQAIRISFYPCPVSRIDSGCRQREVKFIFSLQKGHIVGIRYRLISFHDMRITLPVELRFSSQRSFNRFTDAGVIQRYIDGELKETIQIQSLEVQ